MNIIKKIIAAFLIMSIIAGAVYGGIFYIKKKNVKEVMVTGVSNISSEYYETETYLEGNIATNVSQNVSVASDTIVKDVFVSVGDKVKEGDKLVEFDMTLVQMEYEIAKLKHQKLEQDLATAQKRLTSLRNGGPIVESNSSDSGTIDSSIDSSAEIEESAVNESLMDMTVAAVIPKMVLLSAFSGGNEESSGMDTSESDYGSNSYSGYYQDSSASEFSSGDNGFVSGTEEENNGIMIPSATPYPTIDPNSDLRPLEEELFTGSAEFMDGNPKFYQILDSESLPFAGTGTKEDPYVFLCSSATGAVIVKGTFFNKMAGYSADGSKIEREGGSWFLLEFHKNDTITDFSNRKLSCSGYYLIDGSLLLRPVDLQVQTEFSLEGALQYEENTEEDIPDNGGGESGGGEQAPLSRADAIKQTETRIAGLELDIKESNLAIMKLEKKLEKQIIYSKMQGIVSYVGDPVTGTTTEDAFIKIKSEDGFFVTGSVSELLLERIQEGTVVKCSSYESGVFEATVFDVSEYPTSSGLSWTDGNPNVSYYTFSANINDDSLQVQESDWITITLPSATENDKPLVIMKAFVITENGKSYVYKDDNGFLKKQTVVLGDITDSGYNVIVKAGISMDDKLAFPYGKTVKEGAITREVSLDEMYGY